MEKRIIICFKKTKDFNNFVSEMNKEVSDNLKKTKTGYKILIE